MKNLGSTFWGMVVILLVFWIVIAGTLDWQVAVTGLVISLGVTYFNRDILVYPEERPLLNFHNLIWLLMYIKDFFIAVFKANIQVAVLVLSPKLPIYPGVIHFNPNIARPISRVVLANSITLTPGTLTVFCTDEEMMVHSLTEENAFQLLDWELVEELRHMEE